MFSIIAPAVVLATSALAQTIGSAIVINKCTYDVTMVNVPSEGGGFSEISQTLSPDDTYTQQWTQLTNGNGWSIKLSPDTTLDHIMQYEYTFHNDGTIWYDLSEVDGNPWDGNWEITATSPGGTCTPKQQAYRYSTDDAYGMQACPDDSTITVTLCSGESQNDDAAASASSSVAQVSSSIAAATSTSIEPAPTSTVESIAEETTPSSTLATTTFATVTTATAAVTSTQDGGSVVTEVQTAVYTAVVTATSWRHGHRWNRRHHA